MHINIKNKVCKNIAYARIIHTKDMLEVFFNNEIIELME